MSIPIIENLNIRTNINGKTKAEVLFDISLRLQDFSENKDMTIRHYEELKRCGIIQEIGTFNSKDESDGVTVSGDVIGLLSKVNQNISVMIENEIVRQKTRAVMSMKDEINNK